MRNAKLLLGILFVLCCSGFSLGQMAAPPPAKTPGDAINAVLTIANGEFVGAADAMPEDKYSFAPTTAGEFKGVRTFAQQVKHVAASNYAIWSPLTGEKFPKDFMGGNGPENLKTKAEIIQFVKDSFALGHKAAATLTPENMLQPAAGGKSPRLRVAVFGVEHAFDHYGQMVEYLRMNGIVPPASRGK